MGAGAGATVDGDSFFIGLGRGYGGMRVRAVGMRCTARVFGAGLGFKVS